MPKLNFLEYGNVAYQIKGNDTCSNMVTDILPTDTPSASVECLTPDQRAAGSSLTGVTALWSLRKIHLY